ncbi:hypothetical protein M9H77_09332 [Catharanthus roseus]|uniref:Uncharacterized protein n=1 Tax=Catharanthus roseus TaxID=4058 RepID=A0ACC0C0B0_CATRO|nr:hypothetical protein M9H77_09332 [Catharanthus roseus]
MEEVPVHSGPIVLDVSTRQYEHQSGMIWSGDYETCFTGLQCRRFGRSLFQCYTFTGLQTDDDLILRARGFIFLLLGGHMLPYFSKNLVHTVVHGSFGRCTTDKGSFSLRIDLGVVAYTALRPQLMMDVQASMLQEVDEVASVVIREPPSSPSQMAVCGDIGSTFISVADGCFVKKVQMIIQRCMVSTGGTLGCTPSWHDIYQIFLVQLSRRSPQEHIPDRGAHRLKRGACRQPGRGTGVGRPSVPHFPSRPGQVDPGHVEIERGEGSGGGHPPVDPFASPNLDIPSFSLSLTQPSQTLLGGSGT